MNTEISLIFGYLCSTLVPNRIGMEAGLAWMFLSVSLIVIGATSGHYPVRIFRLIHMGNTSGGVGR
jgi:hypothetical protein